MNMIYKPGKNQLIYRPGKNGHTLNVDVLDRARFMPRFPTFTAAISYGKLSMLANDVLKLRNISDAILEGQREMLQYYNVRGAEFNKKRTSLKYVFRRMGFLSFVFGAAFTHHAVWFFIATFCLFALGFCELQYRSPIRDVRQMANIIAPLCDSLRILDPIITPINVDKARQVPAVALIGLEYIVIIQCLYFRYPASFLVSVSSISHKVHLKSMLVNDLTGIDEWIFPMIGELDSIR